jgi:hypothetical protein
MVLTARGFTLFRRHLAPEQPSYRASASGIARSELRKTKPESPMLSIGLLTLAPSWFYSFASFGITSVLNSCSERSASASDMVPRNR